MIATSLQYVSLQQIGQKYRSRISNNIGKNIYERISHGRLACSNLNTSFNIASMSFESGLSILRLCMALVIRASVVNMIVDNRHMHAIHKDWLMSRTRINEIILAIQRTIDLVVGFICIGCC